jgi:SdrD B-like domain
LSYALLRRIAVGSGALTIALTTVLGGVAVADESPATDTPVVTSSPATPTSESPAPSGSPTTSAPTASSDDPAVKAQPKTNQPVPTMELAVRFDKTAYGSGDDVGGSVTIKNTGTVDAHGLHMSVYGTNLSSWSVDRSMEFWPSKPGVDIAAGTTLVLKFTANISKPDAPIKMTAGLQADPNNPNTITQQDTATATVTKTFGSGDGTLYYDANGNGAYDQGEGLANVEVKINGGVPSHDEPATKTDANGKFSVTDIPAGHYSLTFDGLGDLVVPSADLHIGQQPEHVFVQARHKVSDTLKATVALNADTYAVGDIAHVTVTLTNSGDHALTGLTAACNRIGDPNQLSGRSDGWGDLRDGHGVTVAAHSTVTIEAAEPVPTDAHRYGYTVISCAFGQFNEFYWDGATLSNAAFAHVPGAIANVEGKLETTKDAVPGVKLYLIDHISKKFTASTVTAADGTYSFTGLPAGIYEIGLVGPWKLTDGEAAWWPFYEGDNPGRNILIEAGPNQPDPAANPTNVPVSPAAQASPVLAYTGVVDVFALSLAAGGALVLGVGLVLLSRRRRTS